MSFSDSPRKDKMTNRNISLAIILAVLTASFFLPNNIILGNKVSVAPILGISLVVIISLLIGIRIAKLKKSNNNPQVHLSIPKLSPKSLAAIMTVFVLIATFIGLILGNYLSREIKAEAQEGNTDENIVEEKIVNQEEIDELWRKANWLEAELNTLKDVDKSTQVRLNRELTPLTRAIRPLPNGGVEFR